MRPVLSPATRLALAVATLTRYVPRDSSDAESVIDGSREIIREALEAGNLPVARHVVNSFASATREHYEGIAEQLRPLMENLGTCVQLDAELAAQVMPLARAMGLEDLRAACLARLRQVIGLVPSRRKAG